MEAAVNDTSILLLTVDHWSKCIGKISQMLSAKSTA